MIGSKEGFVRNLTEVRERIHRAASAAGRDPAEVTLVAVSKRIPAEIAAWAPQAGQVDLGENYARELADKRAAIPGAVWHFIGALQTGTANLVADNADVVHGIASVRAALRAGGRASRSGKTLRCLIEVDLARRGAGAPPGSVAILADQLADAEGLAIVGLMTVPPLGATGEAARPYFEQLREMRDDVRRNHPGMVELSMGMSLDYEVAVGEGATMVRVGTALFGERAHSD